MNNADNKQNYITGLDEQFRKFFSIIKIIQITHKTKHIKKQGKGKKGKSVSPRISTEGTKN